MSRKSDEVKRGKDEVRSDEVRSVEVNRENGFELTAGRSGELSDPAEMGDWKGEAVTRILSEGIEYFNLATVRNDEETADRLNWYFSKCAEYQRLPTVEFMALALGTTNQVLSEWERGSKGPVRAALLRKAKQILRGIDAKFALEGKINPVMYIFRAKNYYGMQDKQDVVITPSSPLDGVQDEKALTEVIDLLPEDLTETEEEI